MGAAYCTGRKDESMIERTLVSFAYGTPPPRFEHELEKDGFSDLHELIKSSSQPISSADNSDDVESNQEEPECLDLRIEALLADYSSEVRDGHGLLTAADSYYFSLLEFQRRHDSVGIQAEAVRQIIEHEPEVTSRPGEGSCWRERLAEKRAEAVEALANRAKHYAVGKRSSRGLLQITSGELAESTLRGYEAQLDKEYDLAATEIEATLSALNSQPESTRKSHARSLLEQLQRSATFWTSQIEETFEVWQTASMKIYQAQVKRNGAWGELAPAVRALLSELRCASRGVVLDVEHAFVHHGVSFTSFATRTQCCVRLLELDLHQYAHGLSSVPRRQLLNELFTSASDDHALPALGRALLHDAKFCALQELRLSDSGRSVLDVISIEDHPWASVLSTVFGELLCAVSEASTCLEDESMPMPKVVALRAVEEFFVRQPGLEEIRRAAAVYSRSESGVTPLHQAARAHSSWLCCRLLELRANPLACDANGFSALSIVEDDEYCPASLLEAFGNAAKLRQDEMLKAS